MKRRQPHYRENDEEAIMRRREAIVDRALLYAHLLSILDEMNKEDDQGSTAAAETGEKVSEKTGEKRQCPTCPADAALRGQCDALLPAPALSGGLSLDNRTDC